MAAHDDALYAIVDGHLLVSTAARPAAHEGNDLRHRRRRMLIGENEHTPAATRAQ